MNKEEKKLYTMMEDKLKAKKQELENRWEHFLVMTTCEIESGCFEQNAINDLLYMKELRVQIAELEHWTKVLSAACDAIKDTD